MGSSDERRSDNVEFCRYKQALEAIAANHLPCVICGEQHVERPTCDNPSHGLTWAAEDGHAQRLMTPATYALTVLEEAAEHAHSGRRPNDA